MSLKQFGGVFGRNPTFNDVTIEGDLILNGDTFTGLDYQGTWNASTNTPALTGGSGTTGEFYIVNVAGATDLDGITNWAVGDWAMFNGTAWQRVEGGANGNFVDLSASGNVTLSGGTANGVLYLDGSKVATSGSALTFDGTNFGVGGAPTNYTGYKTITLDGGSAGAEFDFKTNGTLSGYLESTASIMKFHIPAPSTFLWAIDTEQMRLNSTGLGIGTSSPGNKLHVSGSGDVARFTNGSNSAYFALDSAGFTLFTGAAQTGNGLYAKASDNSLQFWTNSNSKMVIDSSGNVGIGTSSPSNKLTVTADGATGGTEQVFITGATNTANQLRLGYDTSANVGVIQAITSGTAYRDLALNPGGGNVGIGTSSPVAKINSVLIQADNASSSDTTLANSFLHLGGGEYGSGRYFLTTYGYSTSQTNSGAYIGALGASALGSGKYHLVFGTRDVTTDTAPTERLRIDSSGNVGIGTSSPQAKLQVLDQIKVSSSDQSSGSVVLGDGSSTAFNVGIGRWNGATNAAGAGGMGYFSQGASNAGGHYFYVGDNVAGSTSEAMRIDSSGNLMVGTTSEAGFVTIQNPSANKNSLNVVCSNTSGVNYVLNLQSNASVANTANLIRGYSNTSTGVFFVSGNGDVTNTNNSYGAISDEKLKENIVDATPKLEKLNQVRVVNFNMKGDDRKQLGVIAQELEQIFPSMVDKTPDRDAEGNDLGTTTKSVRYSVFVPMLIKAMQEQQAIIESLTARISALEGN